MHRHADTVVDILAAKLTGIELAKHYSADALYSALIAHPEIPSLREGFLAAQVRVIIGY